MPNIQAYCWLYGERPMSSLCRSPPNGLSLKAPGALRHGKTPKWCYAGDYRALGEAQRGEACCNGCEARRLGLGTTWKPKISNNRTILVRIVVAQCLLATLLLVHHCQLRPMLTIYVPSASLVCCPPFGCLYSSPLA